MQRIAMLLGRICLSLIFVASAVGKLLNWQGTVQEATTMLSAWIAATQLPDLMHGVVTFLCSHLLFLIVIATLLEAIGGLFVLLGFKPRLGACLLILFIIPVTVIMHPFWLSALADQERQIALFMKNLAILGGLLILVSKGGEAQV